MRIICVIILEEACVDYSLGGSANPAHLVSGTFGIWCIWYLAHLVFDVFALGFTADLWYNVRQ